MEAGFLSAVPTLRLRHDLLPLYSLFFHNDEGESRVSKSVSLEAVLAIINKPQDLSWNTAQDWLCDQIKDLPDTRPEAALTDNDKRWRILEHGCQWVSFTPTGGETRSFDPRDVKHLEAMRAFADRVRAEQLEMLREGIK